MDGQGRREGEWDVDGRREVERDGEGRRTGGRIKSNKFIIL